jgi:hypothetical protein
LGLVGSGLLRFFVGLILIEMSKKDPAFLFYSQDFYTGTRTMLPNERACYIDLLVYQHQNGVIPNDLERILMFCNGIDKDTLKATLKAKFKLTDKGWLNIKLSVVMSERSNFTNKQSDNGIVGQFFKKAKITLNPVKYKELKDYVFNEFTKEKLILELRKEQATHEALLKALLKHLENEDENEDENENVKVDYNKFIETWNPRCRNIPKIATMSDTRKAKLRAIAKEFGAEKTKYAMQNLFNSEFCQGQNNTNWVANVDWFLKRDNFIKCLENNYKNN